MTYGKAFIASAILVSMVGAYAQRMPKNSYLIRPAKNMAQLIQQVQTEPVVMDRFTRHFSMTDSEVVSYFKTLRLGRLDQSGVFAIHGVPRNGKIHVTNQALRKGTLVWFDSAGQPALLEICGNPMTLGPKRMTMANLVSPQTAPAEGDMVAMSTMPTAAPVPAVMTEMVPATPTTPTPREVESVRVSGNRTNLLPLLIPAGLVAASLDGNSQPVPEPATMTALALGVGALAARRKKKN